ncbi:uncharacterized protein LOC108671472 [Hyalella azteca]|uniref:Uncharacterized protein LOC108671472 n=1 Tax=Hyalella azteca TaxID=294128 RepID=A0A8B7NLG6_HYAAZ|nr:uncharacterized protein LOC108671472 [Hyalella azteca]
MIQLFVLADSGVCRNGCFVDSRCLAVSITQAASVSKCYFSSSASVLTTLLITDPASITFMKKKDACKPGFEAVGGFCYFFSTNATNFTTAKSSCPSGIALAYPSSAAQMADLVANLNSNKSGKNDWWVDLTLNAEKWYWNDGKDFFQSGRPGEDLGTEDKYACARLHYEPPNYIYAPWNKECTDRFFFVCQYKE